MLLKLSRVLKKDRFSGCDKWIDLWYDGGYMDKLKLYNVTKSSSDGMFTPGDLIWLSENEDLNSVRDKGWLTKEEWDQPGTNDFECEISNTHYLEVHNGRESVRLIK